MDTPLDKLSITGFKSIQDLDVARIEAIVGQASPEHINNSPVTAPAKRLEALMPSGKTFKKTITGIAIAEKIGVERMRRACPLFDRWLLKIESLTSAAQ